MKVAQLLEIIGYSAALGAAACWAIASLLSISPVRALGAIPFNALRMFVVASLLTVWLLVTQQWLWPDSNALRALVLSGFVGIFLGDTLLFVSIKILGPRMAGLLFATNAPISFALGLWILGESYYWLNLVGVISVTCGIFFAISARSKAGGHQWEQSLGHVGIGLITGFGAALCQSLGTLIVLDTMRAGQDPVFATMIRVWVAVVFLFISLFVPVLSGGFKRYKTLNIKMFLQIVSGGILAMAIGMSLLLWAINLAPMGIVAILSATTPVIVLPALWLTTGERPSNGSFFAALMVVAGTAMIFIAT